MQNQPIEYLKHSSIANLISHGLTYIKSAETLLRLPRENEIGTTLITYVLDGDTLRQESCNVISKGSVIARNSAIIGQGKEGQSVYNEWVVQNPVIIKNYGEEVMQILSADTFTSHKKKATVKAIALTPSIMRELGLEGNILSIKVDWSQAPMSAKVGDYLTSGGYSISSQDMKDYEVVRHQEQITSSKLDIKNKIKK